MAAYARRTGCSPDDILDFSANMNPLGPPEWLRRELSRQAGTLSHYPDPDCMELKQAAAERYGLPAEAIAAANGTSELISLLPDVSSLKKALIPVPSYLEYEGASRKLDITFVPLADGFKVDFNDLESRLQGAPALVWLGQPNNPTGLTFSVQLLRELASNNPESFFIVDEAFADFVPGLDRLAGNSPDNVLTLLSLTKFYAVPGLRLGLAAGNPELIARLEQKRPPWSVNSLAQAVGARALRDADYQTRTVQAVTELREQLSAELASFAALSVVPSEANYLLCRIEKDGLTARQLFDKLLEKRVAVRVCDNYHGLDRRYFRVAVRTEEENEVLLNALDAVLTNKGKANAKPAAPKRPAIMLQGVCSNAGKSVLAAGLCRLLLRKGLRVAPFKAQNMSLNSYVTRDGREMGRAQVTQAAACRLEPDVRMNPVLLKPSSDTGSQVLVNGRPVGTMRVGEYIKYKPEAFRAAKEAYDSLAAESDVMVLEGAGSPAEVNLKAHDIVNMNMARYAEAKVLLAADIDRGGSFAALIGTMECLTEWERRLVSGFILNRFRGDASLLQDAYDITFDHTGRDVLGAVPFIPNLGLPEEDSVSFKAGLTLASKPNADLDIAVIDIPHISNFTDADALSLEPDVCVRTVSASGELGIPDVVILPGSKNTIGDMAWLHESGLADAILALPPEVEIIGICGGLQILGREVTDPHGLESSAGQLTGLGLLPLQTVLEQHKTLTLTTGRHVAWGTEISGYEIHHGVTPLEAAAEVDVVIRGEQGEPLGFAAKQGRVWGTYLHGLFDSDEFRHRFLDELRIRRNLPLLATPRPAYSIEPAIEHLADVMEEALDMERIYALIGL